MGNVERVKILIAVMTYPHPSPRYKELVCVAGITESREWIRLYPLDYRYRPLHQRFHKYQWIEVETAASRPQDRRRESRRPRLDTIRVLGSPLGTGDAWRERRSIVGDMPHHTVKDLKQLYTCERVSLGIVRPSRVIDLEVKATPGVWKPAWQREIQQMDLFEKRKPLRKLPYSFHYVFECADSDKPHRALCEDWELGALFLKESERLGSDERAAQSVRRKFLETLCATSQDTRFFMGTRFPYNTWLVLGVFWPPKLMHTQASLFGN